MTKTVGEIAGERAEKVARRIVHAVDNGIPRDTHGEAFLTEELLARALLSALESQTVSAEERRHRDHVEALKREIVDLKAFIRGIGINCQRAGADLAQVAASAKAASKQEQQS